MLYCILDLDIEFETKIEEEKWTQTKKRKREENETIQEGRDKHYLKGTDRRHLHSLQSPCQLMPVSGHH
jgi:hypothetical protein